jgi:hypothetical protein
VAKSEEINNSQSSPSHVQQERQSRAQIQVMKDNIIQSIHQWIAESKGKVSFLRMVEGVAATHKNTREDSEVRIHFDGVDVQIVLSAADEQAMTTVKKGAPIDDIMHAMQQGLGGGLMVVACRQARRDLGSKSLR